MQRKESKNAAEESSEFKVDDRRHWAGDEDETDGAESDAGGSPARPTVIDEFRGRAEEAERKLQEYIEAFKGFKEEQDQVRTRLQRDVERRVELGFGGLVTDLLESLDDLDLALDHVKDQPAARSLAEGVEMARKRFLGALQKHGVEPLDPTGTEFDPNEAEALQTVPVESAELDGTVIATLRPGYRLGERVIRPARVTVGRYVSGN